MEIFELLKDVWMKAIRGINRHSSNISLLLVVITIVPQTFVTSWRNT